jgi:hypothetical protein
MIPGCLIGQRTQLMTLRATDTFIAPFDGMFPRFFQICHRL